jgi:hypothetical protein
VSDGEKESKFNRRSLPPEVHQAPALDAATSSW